MQIMNIPEIVIKKILYTTDLSESGRYAFPYAASLTRRYNAELTVLHVVKADPELDRSLVGYISDELWEDLKKQSLNEAQEVLIKRKRDNTGIEKNIGNFYDDIQNSGLKDSIEYDIVVDLGYPVEKILGFAEKENIDLIVMASHGNSKLEDAMMGSTTRRVLRRSIIPVLVVRIPKTE